MLEYEKKFIVQEPEFMDKYCRLVRKIWLVGSMTIVSFVFGLFNFTTEDNAIWFQRSGSLIVAFSLFSEYLYFELKRMVTETLIDYGETGVMTRLENFKRKNLPKEYSDPTFRILHEPLIIFTGLAGTIIWGYGDLIYRLF